MSEETRRSIPEALANELPTIQQEIINLHAQWKLYLALYGNPRNLATMTETAPSVFTLIGTAIRDEITMSHGRLLDSAGTGNRATMSVERLIETAGQYCEADFRAELKEVFAKVKEHCQPMLRWRNKRVGHRDLATALAEEKLPDIEREQIERGLEMLAGLMNLIEKHFTGSYMQFNNVLMIGTGDSLMDLLRVALAAQEREFKERTGFERKDCREGRIPPE